MTCEICGGQERIRVPNDEEMYDRLIDKYAEFMEMGMAVQKALQEVGYTYQKCPYCNEMQ